jgi:hypothetical protein
MNRRQLLTALAATAGVSVAGGRAQAGPLTGSTPPDQAEWLAQVLGPPAPGTKTAIGALRLQRFPEAIYALTSPIGWKPSTAAYSDLKPAAVPAGFVTDFASVPSIFWSVLPRDGVYVYAAVLHDYLYWIQDRKREDADRLLLACMEEFSVDAIPRQAVYWGVRAGGDFAWSANTKARAAGERRVLKELPQQPTVKWADWKKRPGVFA